MDLPENHNEELDDLEFIEILEIVSDHNGGIEINSLINRLDWRNIETVGDLLEQLDLNFERNN